MKGKISRRDWETISAYLDGQLSPQKQIRFEARLNQEPHLQNAFEQLRYTRQILRNTPHLRAPRNFTITPEMSGQPQRMPRLAPVFGWASVLASFLLILVLVGDIVNFGGFIPFANNIPQQDEFIAPRAQIVESDLPAQTSVAGGLGEPTMESAEQAAAPEIPGGESILEVAADPEVGSVPAEEPIAASKEIEVVAAAEDAAPKMIEEPAGITANGEIAFETPLDEPREEGGDQQEVFVVEEGVDGWVESEIISETVETESSQEQPTEIPLAEEQVAQPHEEQVEQPSMDAPDTLPGAEPTQYVELPVSETPPTKTSVTEKTGDIVLGAEVILAMCALGTGVAWFYTRRRGG